MATLSQNIDRLERRLLGYGVDAPQITTLRTGCTSSATTLEVESVDFITAGPLEIGDELMWVQSASSANRTITVAARGFWGTTATVHNAGDIVRMRPIFPRAEMKQVLNEVIEGLWPDVYGVTTTTLAANSTLISYSLPADAENVLKVEMDTYDASEFWVPLRAWSVTEIAGTKTLNLFSPVDSGQSIQVTYSKRPSALVNDADEFSSSGLFDTAEPCVLYGAMHRLLSDLDPGRVVAGAGEPTVPQAREPVSVDRAARTLYALHVQLKEEERKRLQELYPGQIHWEG